MPFDICTHDLSHLFWNRLLRLQAWNLDKASERLAQINEMAENERDTMENQTGSIPMATGLWLFLLASHMKPKCVAEVGTFIGKSTLAMAEGMDGGQIWTCDASNDPPECLLMESQDCQTIINAHGKTASTEMLLPIEDTHKMDLFFFDGRIMDADMEQIARLSKPETVYAFDDFEGIEKGVTNVAKLKSTLRNDLVLITPPTMELIAVSDRSTLALLVPSNQFRMTAQ